MTAAPLEETLIASGVGAVPFSVADAEIPESGVAVRPVAVMVPVTPISPVVPPRS